MFIHVFDMPAKTIVFQFPIIYYDSILCIITVPPFIRIFPISSKKNIKLVLAIQVTNSIRFEDHHWCFQFLHIQTYQLSEFEKLSTIFTYMSNLINKTGSNNFLLCQVFPEFILLKDFFSTLTTKTIKIFLKLFWTVYWAQKNIFKLQSVFYSLAKGIIIFYTI